MGRHARILALAFAALLAAEGALPAQEGIVRVVDDAAGWPPYTFLDQGEVAGSPELTGFSVDLVHRVLDRLGMECRIELLPWARALAALESGGYDLALNCSWSEERARRFYLSRTIYTTTAHYFYSPGFHPDGLDVRSLADLGKYRAGGIRGYNYAIYGLAEGAVDTGSSDFGSLFAKLDLGRFDFFVEQYEVVAGLAYIGRDYVAEYGVRSARVPGLEPTGFHLMFPRTARGLWLRDLMDGQIAAMEADGELKALLEGYMPPR